MTVIPTINSRHVRAEVQQPATNTAPSFKANETQKDSFGKKHKESWLFRYRDWIGFFAGSAVGEVIWHKAIKNRIAGWKNMTDFKAMALGVTIDTVFGLIGSKIALQFGKDS